MRGRANGYLKRLGALWFLSAALWACGIGIPRAGVPQCQLSLTLLMDASASIKAEQRDLIRKGTAWALTHPNVVPSLVGTPSQPANIMIRIVEFADRQQELVPWTMITSTFDLDAIASQLLTAEKAGVGSSTGTGLALLDARTAFRRVNCQRNVVDLLTDGENNTGPYPTIAHKEFQEDTDQINVLYVGDNYEAAAGTFKFGPMAFMIPVAGYEDVGRAMLRKLQLEVAQALSAIRRPA